MKGKIDFHHHIVPDFYRDAISSTGIQLGETQTPEWSPELQRHAMEVLGIEKALMSVTYPGPLTYPDNERRRQLARQINDYSKQYSDTDPDHLDFYGSLPSLLDTEGTLAEIDYVYSVLKTNKFIIFTSYASEGEWYYLGDDRFIEIWNKFNSIKALILIHPCSPPSKQIDMFLLYPIMDYTFETCKTAANLVGYRNITNDYPHVKIILSHGGGVLPMIARRISVGISSGFTKNVQFSSARTKDTILNDFKSFYFDTAIVLGESASAALYTFADHDKILFGSDFPYVSIPQNFYLNSLRPDKLEIGFDIQKTTENGEKILN
jgi:6-methylsalicylate decarboxylase